jgi:hypothetical protein
MSRRIAPGRLAAVALLAAVGVAQAGAASLSYDVRAELIVLDAEGTSRKLAAWSEAVGGYFLLRSADAVIMRIPAARIGELKQELEGVAELVVSYEPSARDVREELAGVESAIKSREEALGLILSYIDDADVEGTLALEQEIAGLMGDLESLEGRRQRLNNDAAYARVEVALSSRRQTVPAQRPSSFGWINGVDLYRFLREVLPYGR